MSNIAQSEEDIGGKIMLIDKTKDFDYKDLDFDEIDEGFTFKEAVREAKRCLNCPKPLCRAGCPIENEIPEFIKSVGRWKYW